MLGSAPVERRQASAVGRERVRVLVGEERLAVRIEYRLTELRADVVRDCPVEAVDGHAARRRCVEAVPLEEAGGRVVGVGEQVEHACGAAGGESGAGGAAGAGAWGARSPRARACCLSLASSRDPNPPRCSSLRTTQKAISRNPRLECGLSTMPPSTRRVFSLSRTRTSE